MALAADFPDSELLRLAQAGDVLGFEALYRRHHPQVAMVCRGWFRDEADVADAVQETFVRAFRQLHTFHGGSLFGHWVSRIARRVAIDHTRKVRRRAEVPLEEAVSIRAAADGPGTAVRRLAVRSMLGSLSARDARLLVSHHVEGHSVRELATQWGLTEGAMAVALQRARVRARTAGVRESLPVLVAIAVWRVIVGLRPRGRAVSVATTMPVLAAVVILLPVLGPVISGPVMGEHERPGTQLLERTRPASEFAMPAGRRASDGRSPARLRRNATVAERSDAVQASAGGAHDQAAVVPFDPVEVPGTGRQLHSQRPPGKADYEIGVRVEDGNNSVEVKAEAFDEPAADTAHDGACTAAESAPVGAYCRRGDDPTQGS